MGTNRRQHDVIGVALASRFRINLRCRKSADDLEHQVTAFVTDIAGVQQVFEARVQLKPSMCVSVLLMVSRRSLHRLQAIIDSRPRQRLGIHLS